MLDSPDKTVEWKSKRARENKAFMSQCRNNQRAECIVISYASSFKFITLAFWTSVFVENGDWE